MERAAFAVFPSRRAAEDARDALVKEGIPEDLVDVQVADGDRPQPARISHFYVRYGVPLVVVLGATAGALLGGWWGVLLGVLFAALYGTLAAALSGRIDLPPVVGKLVARARKRRTTLILDIAGAKGAGVDYERFLVKHGAVRVGMT